MFDELTINRFRTARGRILRRQIDELANHLGRPLRILDVGGRAKYWQNVGLRNISEIRLLNNDDSELTEDLSDVFVAEFGDACDLKGYADKSVDLVHSNSVIEHVGEWSRMCAMADEVMRVGQSGWIQTPAWEFPIEPHFKLPFMHWFGPPARRAMLRFSRDYGRSTIKERRQHVDRINLVSYPEVKTLFPQCEIFIERLVLAKSYTARWYPPGLSSA
jgi:hypothetical protein